MTMPKTPDTRIETDSMGEMRVPVSALYGASTARAILNFPIAERPLPRSLIHALGLIKSSAAQANEAFGRLTPRLAQAIIGAADEVAAGSHDGQFPVDVYQTGSGTSSNVNANEVIASLANRSLGLPSQTKVEDGVHPNDHVNLGQSSNDVFPTAMAIAAAAAQDALREELAAVGAELCGKAEAWKDVVKVGRTHGMDATPIRFGQVLFGYARQLEAAAGELEVSAQRLRTALPLGGTAVGTGLNTVAGFGARVAEILSQRLGVECAEASDHPAAQSNRDDLVSAHAALKRVAVACSKLASDIRLLGSGPRCGLGELRVPAVQPGSSIMPGKVNPVLCESLLQVCCRVIGNDTTLAVAGLGGVGGLFELHAAMPVMIDTFLESCSLLQRACRVFRERLLQDLEVDRRRCAALLEDSLMNITALVPELGYDRCAELAQQAAAEGRQIRDLVLELGLIEAGRLDQLLAPEPMTRPS